MSNSNTRLLPEMLVADQDELGMLVVLQSPLPQPMTAFEFWTLTMSFQTGPIKRLTNLRNGISYMFGGKSSSFVRGVVEYDGNLPKEGTKLQGMTVARSNEHELSLVVEDRLRKSQAYVCMSRDRLDATLVISTMPKGLLGKVFVSFTSTMFVGPILDLIVENLRQSGLSPTKRI